MKLSNFISQLGDKESAELFDTKERTVISWRLEERKPKTQKALQIIAKTKDHPIGEVTFEDIYA